MVSPKTPTACCLSTVSAANTSSAAYAGGGGAGVSKFNLLLGLDPVINKLFEVKYIYNLILLFVIMFN